MKIVSAVPLLSLGHHVHLIHAAESGDEAIMKRNAAEQATDRDLDLWFQLRPGYATSGGRWITPELSMRKLARSQAS